MNSDDTSEYFHSFHSYLIDVVEYSYTEDPEFLGIMIRGIEDDFLKHVFKFTRRWKNWEEWKLAVIELVVSSFPTSFAFKVDWVGLSPAYATFYCRYSNGIPITTLQGIKTLHNSLPPVCTQLSQDEILDQPSIVGIRLVDELQLPLSLYYDVRSLSREELHRAYANSARSLGFADKALESVYRLDETIFQFSPIQFLGLDVHTNSLKMDFPRIPVLKFLHLFESILDNSEIHKERFRMIVRYLNCDTVNYLGLKIDSNGALEWKAYFSVSQRSNSRA